MKDWPSKNVIIKNISYILSHESYSNVSEHYSNFYVQNHFGNHIFSLRVANSPFASCGHHTLGKINNVIEMKNNGYSDDSIIAMFRNVIEYMREMKKNDEPRYTKKNFVALTTNDVYTKLKEILPKEWFIDESRGHVNYSSNNKIIVFVLHVP